MFKLTPLLAGSLTLSLILGGVVEAQAQTQAQTQQQQRSPSAQARQSARPPPVILLRSDADLFAATLAGRFAQGTANPVLAAQAWSRAFMKRPTDGDLFERAISANLEAGDVGNAVRLAKIAAPALITEEAALALAVDAFAANRYGDVTRVLSGRNFQPSQRVFADHLAAYALIGQNKRDAAVELTSRATGVPALEKAALMSRAMILDRAGRSTEAGILFDSALNSNVVWPVGVRFFGDWLVSNGNKPQAIAMYQRLVKAGGVEASGFVASLDRIETASRAPIRPDLRSVAGAGLVTIAQSLAAEGRGGVPMSLLNLVAYLDPRSDGISLALADQLISQSRGDLARSRLMLISSTSADYVPARSELAWLVFEDNKQEAVALARETLRNQPDDTSASRLLADILAANRDDREAEALYSVLIAKSSAAGQSNEETWPLYFGRGGSRERQGNWTGALADLRFAKAAAPNQPNVLNYLGYALADRSESLDEALVMLRTAVRLRPRSGSILDSLGWALFRAGQYEEAVSTLETAASLSPALAEITEHLGDAYWRSGREDEARMEWERTLRLEATAAQKQSASMKLRDGLPPDPGVAARRALASQSGNTTPR